MFGLTWEKIFFIGVLAALIIGPERLPQVAASAARGIRRAKEWALGAKEQIKDEMGPEFDLSDWRQYDPRQYDPRRIIREALMDDPVPAAASVAVADRMPARPAPRIPETFSAENPPPFDDEAT